jgi:hypothetical protein
VIFAVVIPLINDGGDVPPADIVETWKLYVVAGARPVTVAEPSVIGSEWFQIIHSDFWPLSSYSITVSNTITAGSFVQVRVTVVGVINPEDRSVGAEGTKGAAAVVIFGNTVDGGDVPTAVTVETRKLYVVSAFKPVTAANPLVIVSE